MLKAVYHFSQDDIEQMDQLQLEAYTDNIPKVLETLAAPLANRIVDIVNAIFKAK